MFLADDAYAAQETAMTFDTVVLWPEHASVEQIERFGHDVAKRFSDGR